MKNMANRLMDRESNRVSAFPQLSHPDHEGELSGVAETAMITLWARAQETLRPAPLIKDPMAVEWLQRMDYDFRQFDQSWKTQTSIAIRTWILDREISKHLDRHPESAVINLGSGFDNRFWRMDNGSILWYDIDQPAVIDKKLRLVEKNDRYRMLGKSIMDISWPDELETDSRPVTIIAEGLLMYLEEFEISALFAALVTAYPGADMFLELLAPGVVGSRYHDTDNTMNAGFKWSILNSRDLKAVHSKLQFVDEWCVLDFFRERWAWIGKYADFPMFRNYFGEKIVHVKFR
jgi:O-methyltransferase involved in polyketide biosynthesis